MVKWYNESLPRISWEFDSPWPHKTKTAAKSKALLLFYKKINGLSNSGLRYYHHLSLTNVLWKTVEKTVYRWIKDSKYIGQNSK